MIICDAILMQSLVTSTLISLTLNFEQYLTAHLQLDAIASSFLLSNQLESHLRISCKQLPIPYLLSIHLGFAEQKTPTSKLCTYVTFFYSMTLLKLSMSIFDYIRHAITDLCYNVIIVDDSNHKMVCSVREFQ